MAHARNNRVNNRAQASYRKRVNDVLSREQIADRGGKWAEVDMGGGSGRIGTRITPIDLLSKADRLRPAPTKES